jgi:hypothetical protein
MKKYYYDVHVFISRKNGYSVPVCIESKTPLNEDEVITKTIEQGKLDSDAAEMVDYIEEISKDEYNDMQP